MQVIYARQPIDPVSALLGSIFLAGPTPRRDHPFPSWRPDALKILVDRKFDGTIFLPEDEKGLEAQMCTLDYMDWEEQIEWEEKALETAICILFWVPRRLPEMPAFTTNDEWGFWKKSGKVVFGSPPGAIKTGYQRYYAKKYNVPLSDTLEDTVDSAIKMSDDRIIVPGRDSLVFPKSN